MAHFHPDAALLTGYAAGTLPEPVMLVVATHLAACHDCRAEVADLLRMGGYWVENSPSAPVSAACRARVLGATQGCFGGAHPKSRMKSVGAGAVVANGSAFLAADAAAQASAGAACSGEDWPGPIRHYLARLGQELPWKSRGFGMRVLDLPCNDAEYSCFLMDVAPGRQVPAHAHTDEELVVVLQGAVLDGALRFERGDFIYGDAQVLHDAQASDPSAGCVCLVALRGDVKFRGRLGPFLNLAGQVQKLL